MPSRMRMSDINLLEILTAPKYQSVLSQFRQRELSKKEILYLPGGRDDLVFLVKQGRVRVYLAYEDKEFTLSILEPGDIFSTHTRAFTQALEETSILVTETSSFKKIFKEFPSFAPIMIRVLGDTLSNAITIINGQVFKEVNARLAEFLISAAKDKGSAGEEGISVELGLTIEDIANVVGSSRQTISILLGDLQNLGLIKKCGRGKYLIPSVEKLKELSDKY